MKTKKNFYVLIPMVLIVWGLIGYRISKSIQPKQIIEQQQSIVKDVASKRIRESEASFQIKADYRDPFFNKLPVTKKRVVQKKQKQPVIFPSIQYVGFMASTSKKQSPIFILSINNRQELLKRNGTAQELKLIRGNEHEVVLRYQGEERTFFIQH